jgi:hypothetical protein
MWFQWFSFWGLWGFTMAFWLQFGVNLGGNDLVCYDPLNVPSDGLSLSFSKLIIAPPYTRSYCCLW